MPARDLWLVPLISIVTLLVMLAAAEVCARFWWPEQLSNSCRAPDGELGFKYRGHPSGKGQRFVAHDIAEHYAAEERGPFTNCRSEFPR